MAPIYHSLEELAGDTPLLRLCRFEAARQLDVVLLAKLEGMNPAGSAKDRAALFMLNTAEQKGLLQPGGIIVEPTSGNTGIGLAAYGVSRGYRVILTMPDTMSQERIGLLKAYGAEIVLTPGEQGMEGAVNKARELAAQLSGAFIPGQFENPANPAAHFATTGPEIWRDTQGKVDIFVACIGTGGTLTGVGGYLKSQNPAVRVIGVEPAASPLLTQGWAGSHGIQGIGANFIPRNLDSSVYDEIIPVQDEEAYETGRMLVRTEGLLAGISSGAAICAAQQLAKRQENKGKTIVTLLPDTGERYLSTKMFME